MAGQARAVAASLEGFVALISPIRGLLILVLSAGPCLAQQSAQELWQHIYHPARLHVLAASAVATGVTVDATKGKHKNGCRSEADGDLHCWIALDPGQEGLLNQKNYELEDGNLVFEPICQHKVTQVDAVAACKDFHQNFTLPPVGSHVRIKGAHILDTQHGWEEFHPVWSLEVIPPK
jgi:hypothetical protein